MTQNDQFIEYIKDVLEPFGVITFRKMFGGCMVYRDGIIFAIIAEGELYIKSTIDNNNYFKGFSSERFSYRNKNKLVHMAYWKVPVEVMEDSSLLEEWVNKSS